MTSNKYWQALLCASLLCSLVQSRVCEGAFGAPHSNPPGIDNPEIGGAAVSEIGWDAGAPSSGNMASAPESKIIWEIPVAAHAHEASIGGINESLAAEESARWNVGGNGDAAYVSNRVGYHPGTRVIVDVEASGTSRTQANGTPVVRHYLAEFRNLGYWPYRLCFESAAHETHSKGGDAWMQVRISKRGRVVAAKLLRVNIDPPQIAMCILNATRSIRLIRTPSVGAAIKIRVRVFPGDAPLPVTRKLPDGKATLEPEHIRGALHSVKNTVEQCIRDGISQDPRLWGRLALLLHFNKQGQVVRTDEYDSHFPDASVVKCTGHAFRELRLAWLPESTTIMVALRVGTLPKIVGESNLEPRPVTRASPNSSDQ